MTAMDCDELSVAAGLGSSGQLELWDRRTEARQWRVLGHSEGVYSLSLGPGVLVSGGEDHMVRVWARGTGDSIACLQHHTYIVWSVQLSLSSLVTASYDCTVTFCDLRLEASDLSVTCDVLETIQGPWEWADALYLQDNGDKLVVQDEDIFVLIVWDVKSVRQVSRLEGHTDEVNSVDIRGHLLASGGCDTTVRLWDWRSGQCVALLRGHGGKVWSVSCDLFRVASGGRGGEVRIWSLEDTALRLARAEEAEAGLEVREYHQGRGLFAHPRTSSVASIKLDRFGLISGDGLAMIIMWDFWSSQTKTCPCKNYKEPVPDPIEL